MKVVLPNTFQEERIYIVDVILKEFLGLRFDVSFYDGQDYKIILPNSNKITIQDHFFSKLIGNTTYLQEELIPRNVEFATNSFIPEQNIPIIYGTDQMIVQDDEIDCGIDIFAASFFMLTRWEEHVKTTRDDFNRFPAKASLAYQHNFLDRPIVNEYTEMLWSMLNFLGIEQKRNKRSFTITLTHDVDHVRLWNSWKDVSRTMLGDLIRRKNGWLSLSRVKQYLNIKKGKRLDPYDTFDELMDFSEALGLQSRFYFMSGGLTKYDNHYNLQDPTVKKIIQRIKDRQHVIGFHPSFQSYNNPEQWNSEKIALEKILGIQVKEGRQHYLRFQVPETWGIWDQNNMETDMSLGYPEREGFRCGTCYKFSVFHILKRKRLNLKESPLIVMESSFDYSNAIEPEMMFKRINILKERVKKYNGDFVFLWHNSNFYHGEWEKVKHVYPQILSNGSALE